MPVPKGKTRTAPVAPHQVPRVTAHSMRGLHSTLAVEHGVSGHVVAASLGHESSRTTVQSYIRPETVAGLSSGRR